MLRLGGSGYDPRCYTTEKFSAESGAGGRRAAVAGRSGKRGRHAAAAATATTAATAASCRPPLHRCLEL